jgi:hypothetical protein
MSCVISQKRADLEKGFTEKKALKLYGAKNWRQTLHDDKFSGF